MTRSSAHRTPPGPAFIPRLRHVLANDTGFAARLRREAGTPLSQSRTLVSWYRFIEHASPDLQRRGRIEVAFVVATLYAHDRRAYRRSPDDTAERTSDAAEIVADRSSMGTEGNPRMRSVNFGATLGSLVQTASVAESPLARRLATLLDSSLYPDGTGSLPWRLRQSLALVRAKQTESRGVVDWARLLDDLLHWNHPDRSVQRNWARSFYHFAPASLAADSGPTPIASF